MMTYEDAERLLCNQCIHHVHCMIHDKECEPMETLKRSQWIPCSERLPEKNKAVLVYVLDAYEIAYLDDAEDWIHCMGTFYKDEVEAWMPLPEPYKEDVE